MRYERPKVGREFQTAGTAAEMLEPKGQIAPRTGSAEISLMVSKRDSRGTAATSQTVLRVTQAFIPWQSHWRRHLQFISDKYKAMGSGCQCCKRDLYLRQRKQAGNSFKFLFSSCLEPNECPRKSSAAALSFCSLRTTCATLTGATTPDSRCQTRNYVGRPHNF